MELSKGAQEVIKQAQKLRLDTDGDKLCVEHIFYGLLLMACYLDEPLNDPEYLGEAKKLRSFLEQNMRSIASATHQLKEGAKENTSKFVDASPMLGRASELAVTGKIGVMELAYAAWETATPTIHALRWARVDALIKEDERYQEKPKDRPAAPRQDDVVRAEKQASGGVTPSQMMAFLALLAAANEQQKTGLRQNAGRRNKNIRRRTKLGLFTYRGGTVAAAVQYFLFGLLIPFVVLAGLELLTGTVSEPATPLVAFLINVYIILWGFYLFRGAALLLGLISNAFGAFLEILSALALITALTLAVRNAWDLPAVPTWLRIVSCASALVVLLFGTALYEHLRSEGDVTKTKIDFGNIEGTPGKIFFKTLTKELILPLLIFAVIWITRREQPLWAVRCYWIAGFLWLWNVIHNMYTCLELRNQASHHRHKGKRLVRFLQAAHIYLLIVELILLLHWLFAWFPMKVWVIILLSVYTAFMLLFSLIYAIRQS